MHPFPHLLTHLCLHTDSTFLRNISIFGLRERGVGGGWVLWINAQPWQTVKSHEGAKLVNTSFGLHALLLINSAAFTSCNVLPLLCFVSHCFALQCLPGAAIVICIQSKYTAGGGRLVGRAGLFTGC